MRAVMSEKMSVMKELSCATTVLTEPFLQTTTLSAALNEDVSTVTLATEIPPLAGRVCAATRDSGERTRPKRARAWRLGSAMISD